MVLEVREFLKMLEFGLGRERIPKNHQKWPWMVKCGEEILKITPKNGVGSERIPKMHQDVVLDVREFLKMMENWVWEGKEFLKMTKNGLGKSPVGRNCAKP